MSKALNEQATTSLVLEALRAADDFMDRKMLEKATGRKSGPVAGALHSLHKYRVIDVVIDENGKGWWFALPPESDTRQHTVEEHKPYPTGFHRKRRKQ